ncbi:FAS1 domain-containing protein [Gymnopilus junonius]|uniref:FAS1 domain-containing protein n=1 Tax=Gymnopilus junonius TaxID=109634 RepID=A0A9P5TN06_GYMJU|nr:FAS1 domain-containing protein [Gymnopilus junonius]
MRLSMRPYSFCFRCFRSLLSPEPKCDLHPRSCHRSPRCWSQWSSNVVTTINGTEQGQTLLAAVSSGSNYTLFAPQTMPSEYPSQVSGILASWQIGESTTLRWYLAQCHRRTNLLNASEFVSLPGNKSQVLAWTRPWENGNVTVLNQIRGNVSQNVTVVNGTLWQNLLINTIDGYLSPPDSLSTALVAVGASNTDNLLSLIPVTSPNGTNVTALADLASAQGMTIFIPNNEAFTSNVNLTLQGLMNNQTAVKDLIQNHIVNGSSLYSPLLSNGSNATSAAGEPLQFTRNDTGLYVSGSNGVSARIVRPDVLLDNGVGHIIDAVLIDTDSNPSAATEAYSSAIASASSATATETGPLGIIGGPTSASQATTMSSASSSSAVSSSSVPSSSSASSSSSSSSTSSSASSSASSASSATSSTGSSTSPSTSLSTSTGAGGQTITVTASGVLAKAHVYASSAGMSSALGVVGSTLVAIAAGACLLI